MGKNRLESAAFLPKGRPFGFCFEAIRVRSRSRIPADDGGLGVSAFEHVAVGRRFPQLFPDQSITVVTEFAGHDDASRGVVDCGIVGEVERVIGADEKKTAIDLGGGEHGGLEERASTFAIAQGLMLEGGVQREA